MSDIPDYYDQNWGELEGVLAWHLIERHADNWKEIGEMMQLYINAKRAQAIDECLQLHESIKVTPPDNDEWIDAIIDSREAYQQAIKQLKEQP